MALRSYGEKGEPPKEENPMRVAASHSAMLMRGKDTRREQNPEVEAFGPTTRGDGVREDEQLCEWNTALKGNPKGGTGMKQGRQMTG